MAAQRKVPMPSVPCGDSCKTNIGSGEAVWTSTGTPMTSKELANTKGVVMLVDNSNAWINGKAVAAKRRHLEQRFDPRWRLHVGKLFHVVMETIRREQNDLACVRIFGSTPPPADGVWKCMSTSGQRFQVDLTRRSTVTNKEKLVDHKFCELMSADYTRLETWRELGVNLDIFESREYVICSGDRDYLLIARTALGYGFHVHIFSFAQALASEYNHLLTDHGTSMTITLLDDFLDQIGFTENDWKLPTDSIPRSRTIVFLGCDRVEKIDRVKRFVQELSIATYIYQSDDKIFVISHYELESGLLESLFQEARRAVNEVGVEVIDVPTFMQRFKMHSLKLKDLEVEWPPQTDVLVQDKESSTMVTAADQWKIVGEYKERRKISDGKMKQSTQKGLRRCMYREFCRVNGCRKGGKFKHSDEEMNFFNNRCNSQGIQLLKTQDCILGHNKSQPGSWEKCTYRHEWEPKLCTVCLGFDYSDNHEGEKKSECSRKTGNHGKYGEKYERDELISDQDQERLYKLGYIFQVISTRAR